jgi:hypothetical protein
MKKFILIFIYSSVITICYSQTADGYNRLGIAYESTGNNNEAIKVILKQ